jgi:hypothetical protein
MIRNSGAHYIVHTNQSLVTVKLSTYTCNMAYTALCFIFINLWFGAWLLVRCFLNLLRNFRIVSIFYRQYNELCRTKMTLSERNTKGKICKIIKQNIRMLHKAPPFNNAHVACVVISDSKKMEHYLHYFTRSLD